ncbi:MAG: methionyl-tRNA formyltransferase [Candidatus Moranbacteria bacterium]|nr:methionyl-tRNA formyltransferase [Candidatus Moranbacteria bacterium]
MGNQGTKIIFFGTPEFAAVILRSLIDHEYNIAAVFTQPDKKVGRKQEVFFSPVKELAAENKIKIFQPQDLRENGLSEAIKGIKPDLFAVAAYGKILPKDILEIPKYGAVNIHASLLPKYRGASPVQCAILAGEKETGITLMKMNEKMDEGDILLQEKIKIDGKDTTDVLMKKLAELGAKMTADFIPDWVNEKIDSFPQDHSKATYCKPVKKEDGKIDWNETADDIFRQWRAYQPWPGIFSDLKIKNRSKRLKLLGIGIVADMEAGEKPGKIVKYNRGIAVQAKKGLIALKKIQLEGKKEMDVNDFVRGNEEFIGSILE